MTQFQCLSISFQFCSQEERHPHQFLPLLPLETPITSCSPREHCPFHYLHDRWWCGRWLYDRQLPHCIFFHCYYRDCLLQLCLYCHLQCNDCPIQLKSKNIFICQMISISFSLILIYSSNRKLATFIISNYTKYCISFFKILLRDQFRAVYPSFSVTLTQTKINAGLSITDSASIQNKIPAYCLQLRGLVVVLLLSASSAFLWQPKSDQRFLPQVQGL